MKYCFAVSALAVAAWAQSTTTTAATASVTQSPKQVCLANCPAGDVNCQAICVGVPHPGESQMIDTTDCVAKCDQGDGSTAASDAYRKCQDACISSFIITSGTAAPGAPYTTAGIPASAGPSGVATETLTGSAASAASSSSVAASKASASASSASAKANAGIATTVSGGMLSLVFGAFAALF